MHSPIHYSNYSELHTIIKSNDFRSSNCKNTNKTLQTVVFTKYLGKFNTLAQKKGQMKGVPVYFDAN